MHDAELAGWVLAGIASAVSLADKKRALMWLGIAGILCNVALVASHVG
jgi:hypothetical protein